MKKKKSILTLKKFTIASVSRHYFIIGAGQTNDVSCAVSHCISVDGNTCATNDVSCVANHCVSVNGKTCATGDVSCDTNTDPLSYQRKGCTSNIGIVGGSINDCQ